jgi:hypothetical protein
LIYYGIVVDSLKNHRNFIYNDICCKFSVPLLALLSVYNGSGAERCGFFTVPLQSARLAAGEARQTALRAVDSPSANRQTRGTVTNFSCLIYYGIVVDSLKNYRNFIYNDICCKFSVPLLAQM